MIIAGIFVDYIILELTHRNMFTPYNSIQPEDPAVSIPLPIPNPFIRKPQIHKKPLFTQHIHNLLNLFQIIPASKMLHQAIHFKLIIQTAAVFAHLVDDCGRWVAELRVGVYCRG